MKRNFKLSPIILILLILGTVSTKTIAYESTGTSVDVDVEGDDNNNFKAGDRVTIKIALKNISSLFAASFLYTYDNTLLEVESINVNNEIESSGVYAPYKDTAKDGNKARYCFTFLGDQPGLDGDYEFVTITGKAKKDGEIYLGPDNITFQLIEKKDSDMLKADYSFNDSKGDIYKVTNIVENKENSDSIASKIDSKTNIDKKNDSQVKVELIEKAEENNEDTVEENNEDINDKNIEENDEDECNEDGMERDSEEKNSIMNSGFANKNAKKRNNTVHILVVVEIIVIFLAVIFYKKIKNIK